MERPFSQRETMVNAVRFLAADAVQQARSGHPGAPLGAASMAFTLWDEFLRVNPANPAWPGRDRFILSAGHASMLLYALLHLSGHDLTLDDLRDFRQWESRTPGHPEVGLTPGVEATTGPLGQGFANGVGMALAQRYQAGLWNRPGHDLFDYFIYALVSDGDLQEGVSAEAASLAGTLGLGRLVYLYDANQIQIEGSTDLAFREDVGLRFAAYGWHVQGPVDGNDPHAVRQAIREAQAETGRPSLIICRTVIGYGSPVAGTAKAHGEPLGEAHLQAAKQTLGWPESPRFFVPAEAALWKERMQTRGATLEADWRERRAAHARQFPELAAQMDAAWSDDIPAPALDALSALERKFLEEGKAQATRVASGLCLNAVAPHLPWLLGGSADLAPSTKTLIAGRQDQSRENPGGGNLHFGVREHAMAAMGNGMALHGGVIPYVATFLTFSDYMRPSMRLAALSGLGVVHVLTHDSIGLGEDGPTHQPIEHHLALRAIPTLRYIRPADSVETAQAWRLALERRHGPTVLALTRQDLPVLERRPPAGLPPHVAQAGVAQGGYILWEDGPGETPARLLLATGSEVALVLEAARTLAAEGTRTRVVSMPCWDLFDAQPQAYRDAVLPPAVTARVSVEAGVTLGWERYVGTGGVTMGLNRFGASAPFELVYEKLGLTTAAVVATARTLR